MSQGALSDVKSGRSKEPTGMSAVQLHALYIIESKKSARQPQKAAA